MGAALLKQGADAWNNNDAAALAAMFTEDAVIVTDKGPIYGREAIEKVYTDLFKRSILATMSALTIKFPLTL